MGKKWAFLLRNQGRIRGCLSAFEKRDRKSISQNCTCRRVLGRGAVNSGTLSEDRPASPLARLPIGDIWGGERSKAFGGHLYLITPSNGGYK